jgi:hypothetical protein
MREGFITRETIDRIAPLLPALAAAEEKIASRRGSSSRSSPSNRSAS